MREQGKQAYLGSYASEETSKYQTISLLGTASLDNVSGQRSDCLAWLLSRREAHVWVREQGKQAYLGGYALKQSSSLQRSAKSH